MFEEALNFLQEKKAFLCLIVSIGLLLTIYPEIFKYLYHSGRDFGRSFVNMIMP